MPIAKIVKGKTPDGCLAYVLGKPDAVLHQTNCVGHSVPELSAEFDLAIQAQMQRQTRGRKAATTVYHTSIAFDLEAKLSREQKLEIAHRYLEGMGFDRGQNAYVIAEHHDTQHQHLHLIISRVRWDGYTTPCWQDYQKAEQIMRQVEVDYGLKPVASSRAAVVKAPTVAEVRRSRSTGQPIPRAVIQQAVDACLERGQARSLEQLQQQLQNQHGITLTTKPVETRSGAMTLALLFELEGRTYSASKLGRKYRYSRLKQGFEAELQPELTDLAGLREQPQGGVVRMQQQDQDQEQPQTRLDAAHLAEPESSSWATWLEEQEAVPEQMQHDWALWTKFVRETDAWLEQKGIAPAPDQNGPRRLAQVALYCRLNGYASEQVARALLISPYRAKLQDQKLEQLDWQERDKEQFSLLKLMVRIDQQVIKLHEERQQTPQRQEQKRGNAIS
ncbi:MAG: relaxase/mobilization nuclease domain-containing protein [Elainella sp.]